MRWILPLLVGTGLWGFSVWSAYPRELWDIPAFWWSWGLSILLTGGLGAAFPGQSLVHTALVFLPLPIILGGAALATGGGFGLLPVTLLLVAGLGLPAWGLAALAGRIMQRR